MITLFFFFPCDIPDGNDVLLTSLPTSIPESDLRVASGIFCIFMFCIYTRISTQTFLRGFEDLSCGFYSLGHFLSSQI